MYFQWCFHFNSYVKKTTAHKCPENILLLGGALNKFSQQILLISLHLWIQTSVKLFENANVCIKWNSNDKNLVNKIRTKCTRNRSTDVVGLKKLLFTKSGA